MKFENAIILAAGKGSRLDRPDLPKPLARVGHKSLLLWTIERLQESGVKKIFVVIGHEGERIKKTLIDERSITFPVEFITQRDVSDAGMVESFLAAADRIDGPAIITAVDLVSEQNPYALDPDIGDDELAITVGFDSAHYERAGANVGVTTQGGVVIDIGKSIDHIDGYDTGVYYLGKNVMRSLRKRLRSEESAKNLDRLLIDYGRAHPIKGIRLSGEWYDINTPATLVRAELFMRRAYYTEESNVDRPHCLLRLGAEDAEFTRTRKMVSKVFIGRGLARRLDEIAVIPEERIHSPHFLITDTTVDAIYGANAVSALRRAGYSIHKLVMPAGEGAKSLETYAALAEEIFGYGLDEGSMLIDIGGGVVNNMAGMLAATLYRGIGLIHIPTTTMAQFDAAIDFKQAVNHSKGKNLIGAYHPAVRIIIDPDLLGTLPDRHVRNGLAESLKHAITQERDFYDFFMAYGGSAGDPSFLEDVARRTVALKVPLLSGDTADEHNEMAPQYGHCIGHAIEHISGYELLHGEAIAIGSCVSAEVALLLGVTDEDAVDAHYRLFERYHLPTMIPADMKKEDITNAIRYDKHYLGKLPRLGLVERIGAMWHDRKTYAIPVDYQVIERAIIRNQKRH